MSKAIRVLIADDHAVVRKGLRALIDTEPNMEVIDELFGVERAGKAPDDAGYLLTRLGNRVRNLRRELLYETQSHDPGY